MADEKPEEPISILTPGLPNPARKPETTRVNEMDTNLERAVIEAAGSWDALNGPGDPNTIDLYRHARRAEDILRVGVLPALTGKDGGVALVELVERHFVNATLIRTLAPRVISERAGALVNAIARAKLVPDPPAQSYIAGLYAWHGCINMAKLLRRTHVCPAGEADYTTDQRHRGYSWLSACWSEEIARGNTWVRYGVSLARLFEKNRKGDNFKDAVLEDWVPQDSPYWDV